MNPMSSKFDSRAKTWDMDVEKTIRAQKVGDAILEEIRNLLPCRAFEYGCGTGLVSLYLRSHVSKIVCADSSKGMLDVLKGKVTKAGVLNIFPIELDLISSPALDEKFDIIYTMLTLHHIIDTDKILAAFYSMMDSGGFLFIADLDREDGSFHGEGFDGHNGFERNPLRDKAISVGFKNIKFKTITEVIKEVSSGEMKAFPLFLMTAKK